MSTAPSEMGHTPAGLVLAGLCTSLTQAMQEFLQAHVTTINAYAAHWEGPNGPQFEVAHRALTQEIVHVERFVGTLQTDLAEIFKELPQLSKTARLSPPHLPPP